MIDVLPHPPTAILVVEDDAVTAELERRTLLRAGRTSLVVGGALPALDALERGSFLAVLLDYRLPDGEPWSVLEAAQRCVPRVPVILVTGMGDERIAAEVIHRGGADYLIKSEGFWDQLPGALDRVIRLSQAEQSNARLASIVGASDDAILSTTIDGVIQSWNPGAERLFGFTAAEAVGRSVVETVLTPERFEAVKPMVDRVLRGESVAHLEAARVRKDGSTVEVSTTLSPIFDASGAVTGVASISRDISDLRRAEAALRDSAERSQALFEHSPLPMWHFDRDTLQILAVNDAAASQYGYSREELLSMTVKDVWLSSEGGTGPDPTGGSLAGVETGTYRHRRKDGSVIQVEVHVRDVTVGSRRSGLALLHDVTERRKLELQLRQSQKMDAIGQLAGAISHDFNNLLTVINGYADLALSRLEAEGRLVEEISEIRRAGERATSLTRQLLSFSRKQEFEPKVLDLNAIVTDMKAMLERLIGENVSLVTVLSPGLGHIRGGLGQIDQIIMNLAVNGRDAMKGSGILTIETAETDLDDSFVRVHLGVRAGPYVLLAVSDTGCGMDAETQARIFEPFFTTKGEGGTGLGLATVFGIVKQSGGHVYVYSEPGRGTTFKLYFPRVQEPVSSPRLQVVESASRGSETILVTDDDRQVRRLARRVLEGAGYRVLEADDLEGAAAITRAERVDLLLSDVVMPAVSGPELARTLLEIQPTLRVLFVSGYTNRSATTNGDVPANASFLEKPFTPQKLLLRVREVLSST